MSRDCPFFQIDELSGSVPEDERLSVRDAIVEGCTHPLFVAGESREKLGCNGETQSCVIAGGYPDTPEDTSA